jgi:hypothetical protein
MNLFDIAVTENEFNPQQINYAQYRFEVATPLCYYLCNARYLTRINNELGDDALKRLEVKNGSIVSDNPEDFNRLIDLVEEYIIRSQS